MELLYLTYVKTELGAFMHKI